MAIWQYPPDWSEGFKVTYEFKTEVIQSRRGNEQRIAWRDVPRITYEFGCLLTGRDMRSAMGILEGKQSDQFDMPIWNRSAAINGAVTTTTVTMDVNETMIAVGSTVGFVWVTNEVTLIATAVIAAKSGKVLTLDAVPVPTVPADARVFPMTKGHLKPSITFGALSDQSARVNIVFEVDPSYEVLRPVGATSATYDSRDVLLLEPNWSKDVTIEFASMLETLDYGIGVKDFFNPKPFNDRLTTSTYLAVNRDEAALIVDLFRRSQGQQGEFYMPTFIEDMRLRDPLTSGHRTLYVYGGQSLGTLDLSLYLIHIAIFYTDGTYDLRKVTDIDVVGGDTTMILNADIMRDVNPEDVEMICWMPLSRFASDALVINWVNDWVAEIGFTTKSLEVLNAES